MKEFFEAYVEAALWSSDDNYGEPLEKNFGFEDLAPETTEKMKQDCEEFFHVNWNLISGNLPRAGHDFWLTRNGHGCGFDDGDWPEAIGKLLTKASKKFKEVSLVVGDDGKIYQE